MYFFLGVQIWRHILPGLEMDTVRETLRKLAPTATLADAVLKTEDDRSRLDAVFAEANVGCFPSPWH